MLYLQIVLKIRRIEQDVIFSYKNVKKSSLVFQSMPQCDAEMQAIMDISNIIDSKNNSKYIINTDSKRATTQNNLLERKTITAITRMRSIHYTT